MTNTGFLQATVAYRVRASDNAPLGIDGQPTAITGERQAIALLNGATNPNSALYVVQMNFTPEAVLNGEPTAEVSSNCPAGYIFLSATSLILTPGTPSGVVNLTSSANWSLLSQPSGAAPNLVASINAFFYSNTAANLAATTATGVTGNSSIAPFVVTPGVTYFLSGVSAATVALTTLGKFVRADNTLRTERIANTDLVVVPGGWQFTVPSGFTDVVKMVFNLKTVDGATASIQATNLTTNIATLSRTSGRHGLDAITFTRTTTLGQGYFVFKNNYTGETAQIYVVNANAISWILLTGIWNSLGIWQNAGIWKSTP